MILLTKADLIQATGHSRAFLSKKLEGVEPVKTEGSKILFSLKDVLENLYSAEYDLSKERAKLASAQSAKTELEVQRLAGTLCDVDVVKEELHRQVNSAKDKLLALAMQVSAQVTPMTNTDEIYKVISDRIHESLSEIGTGNV